MELELLSQLIGLIYDAALDPDQWEVALEMTCQFVKGSAGAIGSVDFSSSAANMHKFWGYHPDYLRLHIEQYSKINPLAPSLMRASIGDIASNNDLMPQRQWQGSRFYREWAKPQGFVDTISAMLEKSATACAALTVVRHEDDGPADAQARQRMEMLLPHFRRAVLIGKVIELHKVEAGALADTLDGLAAAMFLVDAGGRVMHANAAGQTMLDARVVVHRAGAKLAAHDPKAEQALHDAFANASDAGLGRKGIAIALRTRAGDNYVAHVLPLTAGARRRAGAAHSAVAAVFVRKAALKGLHPIDVLADSFNLTPAEMRVLLMIVEIGRVPEIAPVLGISEATVRAHLQRLFAKTGCRRQADLVKLVASYMSPLKA
jgi:DNA-binding CsgD family transcriptional regulator